MTHRPLVPALASAFVLTTVVAACAEPRGHADHRDEIFTFATVLAIGRVAPARCPGVTVDASGVWALSRTLHVEPADDTTVDTRTDDFAKAFGEQVDKAGAKDWCDDVYSACGPEGTMMRGLLHR